MIGNVMEVTPPEGVPIRFEVASLGARLGAQLLDLVLTLLAIGALVLLLAQLFTFGWWLVGFASLAFFFVRIPYYTITELIWNGATLGKRMLGLQVISAEGRTLSVYAVVARNLTKEAEVFLPILFLLVNVQQDPVSAIVSGLVTLIALIVPMTNRKRQRIGDILAGTVVIRKPVAILLPDAATAPVELESQSFSFQTHQLDHYGAFELQTLEAILRKIERPEAKSATLVREITSIVEAIRLKIGYAEAVNPEDHGRFLSDFYRAQRRHLEARQLFGDRRSDKYHATADESE
ncbi:RDD family protein [Ovoidimarina sediminis]|uniref:RDD family protein n=1 Tax=Ovoidimarina sediminis TaxID=3079856 RepID=UPI002915A257|nr:RDD family protein [Rhodophyticola sp. MJ-SS7]MDU8942600.1 RDD family protein [Rhodophyticola sp. MJ-SS7]